MNKRNAPPVSYRVNFDTDKVLDPRPGLTIEEGLCGDTAFSCWFEISSRETLAECQAFLESLEDVQTVTVGIFHRDEFKGLMRGANKGYVGAAFFFSKQQALQDIDDCACTF